MPSMMAVRLISVKLIFVKLFLWVLASTLLRIPFGGNPASRLPSPREDTVDKEDLPSPYHTVVSLPPPYSRVSG